MDIYIDESGYTGEDFLQLDQPIFVLSSIVLGNETSLDIFNEIFSGLQCQELKHSRIAMRPKGQRKIVNFINEINNHGKVATLFPVHKEFNLVTKIVDLWIEPAMMNSGYNLYKNGGNIALSNLIYITLLTLPGNLCKHILKRFQLMMRNRTKVNYDKFWHDIYGIYYGQEFSNNEPVLFCMSLILGGEINLGFDHLISLPEHVLDISVSCAITTVNYWRNKFNDNFMVIHDNSSRMAKEKWLWDILVSNDIVRHEFNGIDDRTIFPLNVEKTILANSKEYIQLQFADILAGAGAALIRHKLNSSYMENYAKCLEDAGLLNLLIGGIWPVNEVDPKKLGTLGVDYNKALDFITNLMKN